jgi:integrase
MTNRHRNDGLRKLCGCARRVWAKCPHPWHFNFKWAGEYYRFSLERTITRVAKDATGKWRRDRTSLGDPICTKTDAELARDNLRTEIRAGRLQQQPEPARPQRETLTFAQLLDAYRTQYLKVHRPDTMKDIDYQIAVMVGTVLDRADGSPQFFGAWLVLDITTDAIESFRRARLTAAPVGANRDLSLLRSLFSWATSSKRKLAADNPFRDGSRAAVKLRQETARRRRLQPGEAARLFAVCRSDLRALVEAAIETGCRTGELLSLQWQQVRFTPKAELFLPAQKTKTKRDRTVPISTRLKAILEMRRNDPAGKAHPPDAYVFGNEIGERKKSFKRAWERAVLKTHGHRPRYVVNVVQAGAETRRIHTAVLTPESRAALRAIDLHFHDLRREAGSRWLDAGVPLHRIQQWLGHANISQTSTYLCAETADDDGAMRRFEARQAEFELQRIATESTAGGSNVVQVGTSEDNSIAISSTKPH